MSKDRLAECEDYIATGYVSPDQAKWLIGEVKRLRRQVKGLQYQISCDIRSAEAYGNSVSTENAKLREEIKQLREHEQEPKRDIREWATSRPQSHLSEALHQALHDERRCDCGDHETSESVAQQRPTD